MERTTDQVIDNKTKEEAKEDKNSCAILQDDINTRGNIKPKDTLNRKKK
jgi:hypothetical protein